MIKHSFVAQAYLGYRRLHNFCTNKQKRKNEAKKCILNGSLFCLSGRGMKRIKIPVLFRTSILFAPVLFTTPVLVRNKYIL